MKQYFKIPNAESQREAIGDLSITDQRIKNTIEQIMPCFDQINQPGPKDWLWNHVEEGETYDDYIKAPHNIVDKERNVIYVNPLEEDIDESFVLDLKKYCECFFYPMKVSILEKSDILEHVDSRINQYTGKKQYNGTQILEQLQVSLKPDAFCLIGVAFTDLYPEEAWNFIFGIAEITKRTGVFSFARYDPEFFTQVNNLPKPKKVFWKAADVMVHEIGHMFGIQHCIYFNCLMNGSNNDTESEKMPMELCPVCLRKLQSNIKFDILERYKKIYEFVEEKDKKFESIVKVVNLKKYLKNIIVKIEDKVE